MKTYIKQKFIGGLIFGFGIIISIVGIGIIYSSWSGYNDLPSTNAGSGLTANMWNNMIAMVNKSVKQDSEIISVDNVNSRIGIGTSSPSVKLDVNGEFRANSYKIKIYNVGGPNVGNFSLSNSNTWSDLDLNLTINLTSSATVLCSYNITTYGIQHLVTRLNIDGVVKSRVITGDTAYRSNKDFYYETLSAGNHIVKVQYRSPDGGSSNPSGDDWQNRFLQCIVYGDQ